MFITLLLPVVVPYGNPWTIFHPRAHIERKKEFFKWVSNVEKEQGQFQNVPLLYSDRVEKQKNTFIVGKQQQQTSFVPSSG